MMMIKQIVYFLLLLKFILPVRKFNLVLWSILCVNETSDVNITKKEQL